MHLSYSVASKRVRESQVVSQLVHLARETVSNAKASAEPAAVTSEVVIS